MDFATLFHIFIPFSSHLVREEKGTMSLLDGLISASRLRFRMFVAAFAAAMLAAFIFASYSIYVKANRAVENETLEENFVRARAGAYAVEQVLRNLFDQVEQLSVTAEVRNPGQTPGSPLLRFAYEQAKNRIEYLVRVDARGMPVFGYRGGEPVTSQDPIPSFPSPGDPSSRPGWHIIRSPDSVTGQPHLVLRYPVFSEAEDGEPVTDGAIVMGLDPEMLLDVFSRMPFNEHESCYVLLDQSGNVIAYSDHPGDGGTGEAGGRACCRDSTGVIGDLVAEGGGSSTLAGRDGEKQLASYARIETANTVWYLGVHSEYPPVLEPVRSIALYALLIALVGLMAILPGSYLLLILAKKREDAEERARYLEKEKKLLEKLREADREIGQHNRELAVLHDLANEVNKSLLLTEVLEVSHRKIVEVTPYDNAGIYLLEEGGDVLRLEAHLGIPAEVFEEIKSIEVGRSLTGIAAETREAVFVDSMADDPRHEFRKTREFGYRSYAGIPLVYGTRVLGVLGLGAKREIALDDRKKKWLKSIGSIVGMAIGNCLLYEEVKNRAEEMSILYEVGKDLTSTIKLDRLGSMVIGTLKGRLDYPACTMLLVERDEGDEEGRLAVFATSYELDDSFLGRKFVIGKDGVTGWVAQHRETACVPDVKADRRYIEGRADTRAELSIPLMFGDELLGVLDFEKDSKNSFSPDEIRFLTLFANQLSVALYNVNMFEETVRMNQELNRVSELKSEFVSLVSHELRTPLTAIKSSIDIILLKMKDQLDESVMSFLRIAKANVDRLSNMIDNLLDISRIESGRMKFSFAPLDIRNSARRAIENMTPLALQKGLEIEQKLEAEFELPEVYADAGKLEQVFTNIIGNAIKFTPNGGRIVVEAVRRVREDVHERLGEHGNGHREYVQVTVLDTGPGIPESEQDEIFKRFGRIEKTGVKGTGLGLAISKYLVESHGGSIWVESTVGRGSSFSFLIPVMEGEKSHEPPAGDDPSRTDS